MGDFCGWKREKMKLHESDAGGIPFHSLCRYLRGILLLATLAYINSLACWTTQPHGAYQLTRKFYRRHESTVSVRVQQEKYEGDIYGREFGRTANCLIPTECIVILSGPLKCTVSL